MSAMVRAAIAALMGFVLSTSAARAEGAMASPREGAEPLVFPLERTEVSADVADGVTSVRVRQRFRNPSRERVEATYVFPLPDDAAVDAMEMRVGARVVRAVIDRRDAARRRYESARDQGRHAALLEQERPNVFTFSVANIDPGSSVDVTLHYFGRARWDHGAWEMHFPMVVGPRYIPGVPLARAPLGDGAHHDTDRVPDASRVSPAYVPPGTRSGHAVSLAVSVRAGAALTSLEAPAHDVVVQRPNPWSATVSLRDKDEIPNRDFILRWTVDAPELGATALAHRVDPSRPGYLSLTLEPRHDAPDEEVTPRELVFLLDTSGSMQGPPLAAVKRAVRVALERMLPSDSFQIIDFADAASAFAPSPLPATRENVARGLAYIDALVASGGTNQLAGVHAALNAPGDPMRVRYVVFMTDGYIGNEAEVLALTQREVGSARVFSFGVGAAVNRYLLDEVAVAGRGYAEYLRPDEEPTAMVERLYARLGRPYLTDVSVDWGGLDVESVTPSPLPDVSALEPLRLLARYGRAGAGVVTVRGRVNGRPYERRVDVTLPERETSNDALAPLWARERVSVLTRAMHREGASPERVEAVTALALTHHLASQYTSFVAEDATPAAPGQRSAPRRVSQPLDAPEGVNLQSAGGHAVGGAGLSGNGVGGGGYGLGAIGLGSVGTVGGGVGQGYGAGYGRLHERATSAGVSMSMSLGGEGSLDRSTVMSVVRRHTAGFRACYERALRARPDLSGRVSLRVELAPDGRVTAASVQGDTINDPDLSACLVARARAMRFAPTAGGPITLTWPMVFMTPNTPAVRAAPPAPPPRARPSRRPE